ncbi:hypothetical protein GF337_09580 [candidate division KSB1 bacterium]|nr:hypothetical protein [candidate division KSB1 bacterium]
MKFVVLDAETQQPIPAKLVFVKDNRDDLELNITETFGLAPEGNGFFTAFGEGKVTIPAGKYSIYASRGMEYSVDKKEVDLGTDAIVEQTWVIRREIDPVGYIGADFHMHTTNSDGHCSEEERVTSLVGAGLEFAVATDHNYVSDYVPAEKELGVDEMITTCPGNELTTEIGHFNIFPLPAGLEAYDDKESDANIMFKYREGLPAPVVNQVNHPRYIGLDYFGHFGLNPVTGDVNNPKFSWNFEAMEIMNETIGYGLYTSDENKISVWDEWFNFLNKGFRVTGTGNSDSHVLLSMPAGSPRNYVASKTENPANLDPYVLARNIIDHKVSVARGVFVNLTVNEKWGIGSDITDTDGSVDLLIELAAPSWVKVDKVTLYGNAREVWSEEILTENETLNYKKEITLNPEVDTWYVAKAEGSQSMSPIIPDQHNLPVTPVGFTNPIWVDIDGKGFETERDRAELFLKKHKHDAETFKAAIQKTDWWLKRQIAAFLPKDSELESVMIEYLLTSDRKAAREYAYSRITEKADDDAIQLLRSAKKDQQDENERSLIDAHIAKLSPKAERMDFMLNDVLNSDPSLRRKQCQILAMDQYPEKWYVVGPFENKGETGLNVPFPPEEQIDLGEAYEGKSGNQIKWQEMRTGGKGYINLKEITSSTNQSLAYAYTTVESAREFKTVLFFGSDDGAAIWHNGEEIYRKLIRRGSSPYEECIPLTLVKGENEFLLKVDNGTGGWDFYFEIFDPVGKLSQ